MELMELCTKLEKQVESLTKDLALVKEQHAKDISLLHQEIQLLKEELQGFKSKKRTAKLVISSSSSPHDDNSEDFSVGKGNSPKQGRKTGADTKGRRINFED